MSTPEYHAADTPLSETAASVSGRNIVLLSDGTGNSAAKLNKTNVWRLYQALVLDDGTQLAFYDDGVGTSGFKPLKLLGGVFGFGLARNVRQLYLELCEHYRPGDQIYIFGFSRGAFTARVLADLIASCGILDRSKSIGGGRFVWEPERSLALNTWDGLQRGTELAYKSYRRKYKPPILSRPLRWVRDMIRDRVPDVEVFRHLYSLAEDEPLAAVGVWDTVAAYGLPIEELSVLFDSLFYKIRFEKQNLSTKVGRAYHALSIDDQRQSFDPLLWDESEEQDRERIHQLWFPGMHSDVGGGYPDGDLSLHSLNWMLGALARKQPAEPGLVFCQRQLEDYRRLAADAAPMHDSRSGFSSYYRYKPRIVDRFIMDPDRGVYCSRALLHETVLARVKNDSGGYAPANLPANYGVVNREGELQTQSRYENRTVEKLLYRNRYEESKEYPPEYKYDLALIAVATIEQLVSLSRKRFEPGHGLVVVALVRGKLRILIFDVGGELLVDSKDCEITDPSLRIELQRRLIPLPEESALSRTERQDIIDRAMTAVGLSRRSECQAKARRFMFWRRVNYFFKLFTTLLLLLLPVLRPAVPGLHLTGLQSCIEGILDFADRLAFGLLQPWADSWAQSPRWFLTLALLLGLFQWFSGYFSRRIHTCAAAGWWSVKQLPGDRPAVYTEMGGLERLAACLRRRANLRLIYRKGACGVLPGLGLALILVALLGLVYRVAVYEGDALCAAGQTSPQVAGRFGAAIPFDTRMTCLDTGLDLQAGRSYRIAVDSGEAWLDADFAASQAGLSDWTSRLHPVYLLGLPIRRHLDLPWMVLTGEIGRDSGEVMPLQRAQTRFEAPASGRLYVYVNDAINSPGVPVPSRFAADAADFCVVAADPSEGRATSSAWCAFYTNNRGTASLVVTELD